MRVARFEIFDKFVDKLRWIHLLLLALFYYVLDELARVKEAIWVKECLEAVHPCHASAMLCDHEFTLHETNAMLTRSGPFPYKRLPNQALRKLSGWILTTWFMRERSRLSTGTPGCTGTSAPSWLLVPISRSTVADAPRLTASTGWAEIRSPSRTGRNNVSPLLR
jgi:hypothetical protein